MGYMREQVFPFADLMKIKFIKDFFCFIFNIHVILSSQKNDALCSLLLLMGVVLVTERVHAEEKIDDAYGGFSHQFLLCPT